MKPILISIDKFDGYPLCLEEIKYVFQTILTIAGLPCKFLPRSSPGPVDIYFGESPPDKCRLFIRAARLRKERVDHLASHRNEEGIVFLHFPDSVSPSGPIIRSEDGVGRIENDIIFASFYLLSGWQEKYIPRDRRDRHDIRQSYLYRNRLLHTPVVNQYALLIRRLFGETHQFLPTWPGGKRYAVALTHDVDYPEMKRWLEAARYFLSHNHKANPKKIIDILKGRESFWRFEDWLAMENAYNVKSAFYFCGRKGNLFSYTFNAPDPFYDVCSRKYRDVIKRILDAGFEVGMHSSYLAYRSLERFRAEKQRIESSVGWSVYGNRHHYWHMNPVCPPETGAMHSLLGFVYDSSIVFTKHSGFRFGVCAPFHLYDRRDGQAIATLQLPPCLMDDHLFGRAGLSHFKDYREHIDALLEAVKAHEGIFVADYHVRVLNAVFFPDWGDSYRYLLERISADGDYYCDLPINISKYWLERENKLSALSEI